MAGFRHTGHVVARSAVIAGAVLFTSVGADLPAPAAQPPAPALQLVTAASSVVNYRYENYGVLLDLGAYIVAPDGPFELRLARDSYRDPIVASQVVRRAGHTTARTLPEGILRDFRSLPNFLHVTVKDGSGNQVLETNRSFCPAGKAFRARPDAQDASPYPETCSSNPFTLGAVWGIPAGWGTGIASYASGPVQLADGEYTASFNVTSTYQALFGLTGEQKTVKLTVRTAVDDVVPAQATPRARSGAGQRGGKPDLRPLPAWAISLRNDHLVFGATVWNAGPGPLVVEGFRRPGTGVLDAFQYFFGGGRQVGFSPVGTMEWDPRSGHEHWHFTQFATYELVDAAQRVVVRSRKEGFCLADTDSIDLTVSNANWRPDNTSLAASCGTQNSMSVRQVLDVGSGDTYIQSLPGQSFDVTGVPNGTYYIRIVANPFNELHETDASNNTSVREVTLGGIPGRRTLTVSQVGIVQSN